MTTSAEKLIFLPPFTTLVTRLIATTCSFKLSVFGSMRFLIIAIRSELQSRFARGIGQRFHAAVILIPAAIEHHLLDSLFLGSLGHQLADRLGSGDIAAIGLPALVHRR